jgi:hypothetical protein
VGFTGLIAFLCGKEILEKKQAPRNLRCLPGDGGAFKLSFRNRLFKEKASAAY